MKYITLIGMLLSTCLLSGQVIDKQNLAALHKEYEKKKANDTAAVNTLIKISKWHMKARVQKAFSSSKDSMLYYADRALSAAEKSRYALGQADAYIIYSRYKFDDYKDSESRSYAEKALELYRSRNYERGIAEALLCIAVTYQDKTDDAALDKALEAKTLYRKLGDKINEAYASGQVSAFYDERGDPKNALAYTKEAIRLYEEAGYKGREYIKDLWYLSNLYFQAGNMEEAFRYCIDALKLAELADPGSELVGECASHLGKLYFFAKKYSEAEPYFRKAFDVSKNHNDQFMTVVAISNLAQVLMEQHKYKEALDYIKYSEKLTDLDFNSKISLLTRYISIYTYLKEFSQGKKYVDQGVKILNERPEDAFVCRVLYAPIARYYYAAGDYALSRKFYERYLAWAQKTKNKPALESIYSQIYKIDSVQKNFDLAITNLKLSQAYKDSMFNQGSHKRIDELKVQYNLFQKERDLEIQQDNNGLLVKEGEIQQAKLSRAHLTRNVSIAGAVIVLVFLALLYNRHKSNKRTSALLKEQQGEILHSNRELQHMVNEKEWLLKEVHHRVKNNLHLIISLLNSQSYFLQDKAALSAIQNSQHRIQAMSLIHQKLYMADNLTAIRMREYIHDLLEYLTDSFSGSKGIKFQIAIEDMAMDVSQAVPIGLILNEAITNSFKYAFPDGKGNIYVSMATIAGKEVQLEISDDGIGLPSGFDTEASKSLGMKLIYGLAQDLDGIVAIGGNTTGTQITIIFPYRQLALEHVKS